MSEVRQRLEEGVAVLARLEQRRRDTGTPRLGFGTEFLIIARELEQLEHDILNDPGALEPQLHRLRQDPAPGDGASAR
ncbi:MAG: hypothetical protein LAP87_20025 [Acidobacteriia bacterium]|nr:hypothetical protein [Terriglobia bacterium]